MTIAIYCEGDTEALILPGLLRYFQSDRRKDKAQAELEVRSFKGISKYLDSIGPAVKGRIEVNGDQVAFGIIDYFGVSLHLPRPRASDENLIERRLAHLRQEIQARIPRPHRLRFQQHFAVHELEAWLLADRAALSRQLGGAHVPDYQSPEDLNTGNHPAKRLAELYSRHGQTYIKPVDGQALFRKLDPELIYEKCPRFQFFIDELMSACDDDAKRSARQARPRRGGRR